MKIRTVFKLVTNCSEQARQPPPRRPRRVVDRWLPIGNARMIARIIDRVIARGEAITCCALRDREAPRASLQGNAAIENLPACECS